MWFGCAVVLRSWHGSGEIATALVIGVENDRFTFGRDHIAISNCCRCGAESEAGISFVALNALIMQRYMSNMAGKQRTLRLSLNAHANGVHNPYARFQDAITRKSF